MSKIIIFIRFTFLFFTFTLYGFSQTPQPTTTPNEDLPEKVFTEEITLNVSAFDRNGEFVADVKKEDLVILENGRLNQPTSVRRVPANVLIVLDLGGEIVYGKNTKVTRNAAKNLISTLRPDDRFAVLQYHDKVETLSDWTGNKEQVLNALDKNLGFGKRSVFFQAVDAAVLFFDKAPRENRHLVLITDGTDSFDEQKAKELALKSLISSEINVHVISYTLLQEIVIEPKKKLRLDGEPMPKRLPEAGLLGLPDPKSPGKPTVKTEREIARLPRLNSVNLDREMRRRLKDDLNKLVIAEQFLKTIAEDGNGEFFLPVNYEEMITDSVFLAQTIDSQYVVTYAPKKVIGESVTDEIRLIEISSKRDGLRAEGKRKFILVKNQVTK
jgi:von Willebrand factor type A domain